MGSIGTISTSFLNSFTVQDAIGQIDLRSSPNSLLTVHFWAASSNKNNPIYVGDSVIWVANNSNNIPTIDQITDNTAVQAGIVAYNSKVNTYNPGDILSIAMDGEIIKLKADSAINLGAPVEFVVADKAVQTQSAGKRIGYAMDYASAQGQIIRVRLDFQKS